MARTIGIDLGTTTSIMTYMKDGKPHIIEDSQEGKIIHSIVGIHEDGSTVVGKRAKNQMLQYPEKTAMEVKRLFGTDEKVRLGDEEFPPHAISGILLKHLKEMAEKYLNEEVEEAVITVPANFNSLQRELTKQAGALAGLKVERIINEPTAAAIAYGFDQSNKDEKILIYDLGGGTFDVTILEMMDGIIDVICSRGNNRLGGKDFDAALERHVINDFYRKHQINLHEVAEKRVLASIKDRVEEAKKELSTQQSTNIYIPYVSFKDNQPLSIDMRVTRDEFENLIMESVLDTQRTIDEALESANLTENDIDAVILVGGSSRIPLVKETINNKFLNKVKDDINPDTAVALGAAIQAGIKIKANDPEKEAPSKVPPIVTDKSSYNLGVAVSGMLDNQQRDDIFSKIIEKDNSIPCTKRKIYTTTRNNQTSVTIPIYEGDSISVHKNVKIGEVVLDNIPMAKAGEEDISVDFSYDLNGIIKVVATVMSTGMKIDTEIDLSNVVETVSGGLMEKYFDNQGDNLPKEKKTKKLINNEDYKKHTLYKSVENSMKFAESMCNEIDNENIKNKLINVLENMKDAIISNNKILLEKYEMELTDILFEI